MGPLGFTEILIILVIILLLFGAKKIPELMKGLGRGMREFNEAKDKTQQEMDDSRNGKNSAPVAPAAPVATT